MSDDTKRAKEAVAHTEALLNDLLEQNGLMGDEATELAFKELRWLKRWIAKRKSK